MPKRKYIAVRPLLERIYSQQRRILARRDELIAELDALGERYALLDDRAEALVAYDWQSRHGFPLVDEMADRIGA